MEDLEGHRAPGSISVWHTGPNSGHGRDYPIHVCSIRVTRKYLILLRKYVF